eukprot:9397876-Prorocentrum_lima.AAC.1
MGASMEEEPGRQARHQSAVVPKMLQPFTRKQLWHIQHHRVARRTPLLNFFASSHPCYVLFACD